MQIKELLRSAWTTNIEIQARTERLKAIRTEEIACRPAEVTYIKKRISTDIKKLYQQVNRVTELINQVNNPAMRAVLIKRYIQFQRWNDIAFDLHYTVRTVHRFNHRAIKYLENKKLSHNVTTKN